MKLNRDLAYRCFFSSALVGAIFSFQGPYMDKFYGTPPPLPLTWSGLMLLIGMAVGFVIALIIPINEVAIVKE